jgi:nicotinamide-nucleotide amidase
VRFDVRCPPFSQIQTESRQLHIYRVSPIIYLSMRAEIIASGTELLLGEVADVNTSFIAGQLAALGIDLYYCSTVGDNFERFSAVLRQAWERSDLIIITGGLGPTQGDITREVIAGLLGEKTVIDPALRKELTAFFAGRGIEMPDNNLKQATLIPSAVALHNVSGTAPGWWVEKGGRIIVTLPGPPGEMQTMWQNVVLPRLKARSGAIILSRTLKTWGLSEARVDELVAPFLGSANPTLALYAKPDGINLRITAKAATEAAAAAMLSGRERDIREILDRYIWGADSDTLEGIIGKLLRDRKLTLAVAETFTGGLLAYSLSAIPESFKGGLVLVSKDAPTEASATEIAQTARAQFKSDIGLAIDGRGAAGTRLTRNAFIAVVSGTKSAAVATGYPGSPQLLARRTINHALIYLRNFIETNS